MTLVLDASATIAWARAEETTPILARLFKRVAWDGAWAPSLWRLETANILALMVRRGRETAAFRDRTLSVLEAYPIEIDLETDLWAWTTTLTLAEKHRLTVYDAAYLELAIRLELPLATLDPELRQAAMRENVILICE